MVFLNSTQMTSKIAHFRQWFSPRRILYCILLLVVMVSTQTIIHYNSPDADHHLPAYEYLQLDTRLSSRQIHSIREGVDGYVWIGTERGLNRYDGNRYLQFFATSDSCSLQNSLIMDVLPLTSRPEILQVSTYSGVNLLFSDLSLMALSSEIGLFRQFNDSLFISFSNDQLSVISVDYEHHTSRVVKRRQLHADFNSLQVLYDSCFWAVGNNSAEQFDIQLNHLQQIEIENIGRYAYRKNSNECWILTSNGYLSFSLESGRMQNTRETDFVNQHITPRQIEHTYMQDSIIIVEENHNKQFKIFDLPRLSIREESFPEFAESQIGRVFSDSHQNLWCGSRSLGFDVHFAHRTAFAKDNSFSRFFTNRGITSITELADGRLCALVGLNKIYICNSPEDILEIDTSGLPINSYTHLYSLKNGNLLIVTGGRVFECRIDAYGRLQIQHQIALPVSSIHALCQDRNDQLWGACSDGCYSLDLKMGTYRRLITQLPNSNIVKLLNDGRLIFGSLSNGVSVVNPITMSEQHFELPLDKPSLFSCRDLTQDVQGNIWIASIGMGIFRLDLATGQVQNFRAPNMCPDVSCILSDPKSTDIWLGTLNGLSRFDQQSEQFVTFYEADGVQGEEFFERCALLCRDSAFIFGGKQGLTIFTPGEIMPQMSRELRISQVLVGNHILLPGYQGHGYALQTDASGQPRSITLPHDMSTLRLCLSTLDFGDYSRPRILYRIPGVDSEWQWAISSDIAYSQLEPGDYTLEVQSLDQNGNLLNSLSFNISVTSVWWQRWWFYLIVYPLLFLLLVALVASLSTNAIQRRRRIRDSLREKVAIRYASDMNMRFFTNMAHEFRTPLTLISGANGLLGKSPVSDDERHAMGIITNNTNRLLGLVNQLLDFNKLEHDMVRLCVQPTRVPAIVEQIMQMFKMGFQERGIRLSAQYQGLDEPVWIDPDKFDKILTNLLSNALKFTPKGGEVNITIHADGDTMTTDVSDTGIGIPDAMLESIFDRYYQTSEGAMKQNATGIGLCYCRGLARLHHGTIVARHNKSAEHGATFLLTLPIGRDAYEMSEINLTVTEAADIEDKGKQDTNADAYAEDQGRQIDDESVPVVLVVDDEPEVLNFLRLILRGTYRVVTQHSATDALANLPQLKPDLIVSDVMMLGMDGLKFCQLLKEDIAYCHIPVILLTAKVSLEERIQGLNVGADAYVTKPFEPAYLLALIKSLLDNRQRIQHMLSTSTVIRERESATVDQAPSTGNQSVAEDSTSPLLSAQDSAFMDKLYTFMEEHLSDAELDLERLLDIAMMSRSKLYYKVKGLTGMTPNAFFKTYKLNRAAEMIRQGDVKLTYIAELTGFCGSSHFAASFKKQFGVLPSEYGPKKQL